MEADDELVGPLDADRHVERARADQAIADRLDELTAATDDERLVVEGPLDPTEAERVFERALELEADALDEPPMFTSEQLERIADEIGMDLTFVRQALGEVRLAPEERGWLDRLILPEPIMELETIEGLPRADLEALIDDWMMSHEGLIASANLEDGRQWDVDRRLGRRLRTIQRSGGNRISRVAGGDVVHRLHSITDDEHIVAMQSRGEGPLLVGKAGLVAAVLLLAAGLVVGLGAGGLGILLRWLLVGGVGGIGVAMAAIVGARRWARGIGRALKRSLTGLGERLRGRGRPRDKIDLKPIATELMKALADRVNARRLDRARLQFPPFSRHGHRPPSSRRQPPPPPGYRRRR